MTLEIFIPTFKSESVILVWLFVRQSRKLQESHAMQIHPTKKTDSLLSQDLSIVRLPKLFKSNLLIRQQILKVWETSFKRNLIGTSLPPRTFGLLAQKSMDQMFLLMTHLFNLLISL